MQNIVKRFYEENNLSCSTSIRYIDLVSEVGELGKELIKITDYGKKQYTITETVLEEMGDCLFSILALCCEMNIESKHALNYALKKYEKRLNYKGDISSDK